MYYDKEIIKNSCGKLSDFEEGIVDNFIKKELNLKVADLMTN